MNEIGTKNLISWISKLKGMKYCKFLISCLVMLELSNQNHCPKTDLHQFLMHQFTLRCLKKRQELRIQQVMLLVGRCKVGLAMFKIAVSLRGLLTPQNTRQTGLVILWLLCIWYKYLVSIGWVIRMSEENWAQCLCLCKVNQKHPGSLSGPQGKWQSVAYIHMAKLASSLKHTSLVCMVYWEPSQVCLSLQTMPKFRLEEY